MSSIKKIVLEVGGVELSLSPEDAKTLQSALNELFPTKKEIQYVPSPYPVYPLRPWIHWSVPCSTGGTGVSDYGGIRLLNTSLSGSSINTLKVS